MHKFIKLGRRAGVEAIIRDSVLRFNVASIRIGANVIENVIARDDISTTYLFAARFRGVSVLDGIFKSVDERVGIRDTSVIGISFWSIKLNAGKADLPKLDRSSLITYQTVA